ncbi:hypothetical protein [Bifidobacterium platyrrhinorum]|uniref:hypothetical protein n=1 Tax=Bifidobacterium platyrrhinorum TaxID=2661628 RepID=UPI00177DC1FB|nr:hypothetical protein [Bifidobacterium platyrrhinorum]
MAVPIEMVHGTGITTVEENNEWRFGEQEGGVVSVTLVPELFNVADETLKGKYLTGLGPNATTIYIRSGIPLALITSGENTGGYGPYDPDATDGRQTAIAGLLESTIAVNITYSGWDVDDVYVGMRYRGDIVKSKLPVVPADDAVWGGEFYDVEEDKVTALSGMKASATPTTPTIADGSVTSAKLAAGAVNTAALGDGQVTGAKLAAKTVTKDKIADGVIPTVPAAPTWANLSGKPAAAAAIPDPTADTDVMAKQKLILAALRAWGIIAAK